MPERLHSYWKAKSVPKWKRIRRSVSVQDNLQYFERGPFWLWQDLFHRIVTPWSLGRIVCKPSSHSSLFLPHVVRWIPRHERRWCTISRRDSRDRPSQIVIFEGWITGVRRSDGGGTTKSCWIYLTNIFIIKISPCCTYDRTFFHQGNKPSISRNANYSIAFKNPRDQ